MIRVVAKNYPKEGCLEEILEICQELVKLTREEEGCIAYELFQDVKDPSVVAFIETWESEEALKRHLKSEHFVRLVPQMKDLMSKPGDMNIFKTLI